MLSGYVVSSLVLGAPVFVASLVFFLFFPLDWLELELVLFSSFSRIPIIIPLQRGVVGFLL